MRNFVFVTCILFVANLAVAQPTTTPSAVGPDGHCNAEVTSAMTTFMTDAVPLLSQFDAASEKVVQQISQGVRSPDETAMNVITQKLVTTIAPLCDTILPKYGPSFSCSMIDDGEELNLTGQNLATTCGQIKAEMTTKN